MFLNTQQRMINHAGKVISTKVSFRLKSPGDIIVISVHISWKYPGCGLSLPSPELLFW